jgi:hypothetical protein
VTLLAYTDKTNAIIAGVFIDKLCDLPSRARKTFELTVANPEAAPNYPNGKYYGAISLDGISWINVELTDPDGDKKYVGILDDLEPRNYYWKVYYEYDTTIIQIAEGEERLQASKTNTVTWTWPFDKKFELTVHPPQAAPSGSTFYALLERVGWSQEIELIYDSESRKYIGTISGLIVGNYHYEFICRYPSDDGMAEIIIDEGNEFLDHSTTNTAVWRGTTLKASKTAEGHWIRTWSWTIDKNADPSMMDLFVNEEGSVHYTITITKIGYTDRVYVSGTITIENGGAVDTEGLTIVDAVQYKLPGPGKYENLTTKVIVSTGSDTIHAGETKVYEYEVEFNPVANALYRNRVYIKITNHAGHIGEFFGPEPAADFSLPESPVILNDDVEVTDVENIPNDLTLVATTEPRWPRTVSSNTIYEFDKTFKSEKAGTYIVRDTVTIIGDTGEIGSDSIDVEINIYTHKITKTFQLSVTNQEEAPPGVRYYAKLWNENWDKCIELTDNNGIFTGCIDVDPGEYNYGFYFTLDSIQFKIKEGRENLQESKVNIATITWPSGKPSIEITGPDSLNIKKCETKKLTYTIMNKGDATSRAYFLAFAVVIEDDTIVKIQEACIKIYYSNGKIYEAIVSSNNPTYTKFEFLGDEEYQMITWSIPSLDALEYLEGNENAKIEVSFYVHGIKSGNTRLVFFMPSTEDHHTNGVNLNDINDKTNLFFNKGFWYPIHNSFDPWDDDINSGHRWEQGSWDIFETESAFAKTVTSIKVD